MTVETVSGPRRAVVFWDGAAWIGMCLEHYIGTQAESVDELLKRLEFLIEVERQQSLERHGQEFAGIEPAPERYHQMWNEWGERNTRFKAMIEDRVELALCA